MLLPRLSLGSIRSDARFWVLGFGFWVLGFGFCAGIRELLACFTRRRCAFAFALASAMR
jgi:hypothetical protein